VWRWGRLWGLNPAGHYMGSLIHWLGWRGGVAVIEVLADRIADG
jgi:hypothetical protein